MNCGLQFEKRGAGRGAVLRQGIQNMGNFGVWSLYDISGVNYISSYANIENDIQS